MSLNPFVCTHYIMCHVHEQWERDVIFNCSMVRSMEFPLRHSYLRFDVSFYESFLVSLCWAELDFMHFEKH